MVCADRSISVPNVCLSLQMVEVIDMRSGEHLLFSGAEAVSRQPGSDDSDTNKPGATAQGKSSWLSGLANGLRRGAGTTGGQGPGTLAIPVCQAPFLKVSTVTGGESAWKCVMCFVRK